MNEWNRLNVRRKLVRYISSLLLFVLGVIYIQSMEVNCESVDRLTIVEKVSLPIKEISGIHWRQVKGHLEIIAVGDRKAKLAFWNYDTKHSQVIDFTSSITSKFSLCSRANGDLCKKVASIISSDWESLRVAGHDRVILSQEHSEASIILDLTTRDVASVIHTPLARANSKSNHLIEGSLLLNDGSLLVAREYNPTSILWYSQPGVKDKKLRKDRFLTVGGDFQPIDTNLVPIASWGLNLGPKCDLSDLDYNDGRIYALSQSCGTISIFTLSDFKTGSKFLTPIKTLFLPNKIKTAEALTILPNGYLVVGLDNSKKKNNLLVLTDQ